MLTNAEFESDRLTIVSAYFWPEKTGISQVTWEFASYLAKSGFSVDVVTAMPFYPEWQIAEAYAGKWFLVERANGIRILRSWHYVAREPGTAQRLLHEGTLTILAIGNLVRSFKKAKYAYIVSPQLTFAFVAALIATVMRVRFTLIVQDVMPDAAIELGMLRSPIFIGISRYMARKVNAMAARILTLSDGMRRRIKALGGAAERIDIVPNTIDADELTPPPYDKNEFRRRYVAPGVFAVLHTGNMGRKQDLDLLLRAAAKTREDKSIQYYVFGDGAEQKRFVERLNALELDNVHHFPLQDRWLLPHMLGGADLVLVSQLPEVVDIVVPSKLVTAMGAGAAIVAACNPASEAANLIRQSDGGLLIPASDDDALIRAIHELRRDREAAAERRRKARDYASHVFGREKVFGRLVTELTNAIAEHKKEDVKAGSAR